MEGKKSLQGNDYLSLRMSIPVFFDLLELPRERVQLTGFPAIGRLGLVGSETN